MTNPIPAMNRAKEIAEQGALSLKAYSQKKFIEKKAASQREVADEVFLPAIQQFAREMAEKIRASQHAMINREWAAEVIETAAGIGED